MKTLFLTGCGSGEVNTTNDNSTRGPCTALKIIIPTLGLIVIAAISVSVTIAAVYYHFWSRIRRGRRVRVIGQGQRIPQRSSDSIVMEENICYKATVTADPEAHDYDDIIINLPQCTRDSSPVYENTAPPSLSHAQPIYSQPAQSHEIIVSKNSAYGISETSTAEGSDNIYENIEYAA